MHKDPMNRQTLGRAAKACSATQAAATKAHADGRHGDVPAYWAGLCPVCAAATSPAR
jgi:hypothetical protein